MPWQRDRTYFSKLKEQFHLLEARSELLWISDGDERLPLRLGRQCLHPQCRLTKQLLLGHPPGGPNTGGITNHDIKAFFSLPIKGQTLYLWNKSGPRWWTGEDDISGGNFYWSDGNSKFWRIFCSSKIIQFHRNFKTKTYSLTLCSLETSLICWNMSVLFIGTIRKSRSNQKVYYI